MKPVVLGLMILVSVGVAACGPPAAPTLDLPAGTKVAVRLDQALSTARDRPGQTFTAILDAPVVTGGQEVLPRGTAFTGHVTTSDTSDRLEGRAVLGLALDGFDLNQHHYPVTSSLETRTSEAHKKRNVEIIGGGAGIGAIIGALTGGGKGAGLGAAVGAAGGTGVAAATGKLNVDVAANTVLQFSLTSAAGLPQ